MFNTYNRRRLNRNQILRAVNDIREGVKDPTAGTERRVMQAAKELQTTLRGISRQLDSSLSSVVDLADKIIRTRNAGWISQMQAALKKSGNPVGKLLADNMAGKQAKQFSAQMETRLKQAAEILKQIEPQLFGIQQAPTPEKAGGVRRPQDEPPSVIQDGKPLPKNVEYLGNGFVKVKGNGFVRFYRETDPLITGKPIKVTSSNVYAISYALNPADPEKSILYVRYLQADGGYNGGPASKTKVPGPTYGYKGVHPDIFRSFQKAISKGIFVWDNLRVRGTIYGHQYTYFLARIAQMYMPRRAVREGNQVWFRRRSNIAMIGNGRIRHVQSRLPDKRVGTARRARRNPRPPSRYR
jgi:hypothetical protein